MHLRNSPGPVRLALAATLLVISGPSDAVSAETPDPAPVPSVADDRVGDGAWQLPVTSEVVDWFRAPRSEWGPGNRGWEFATGGGESVLAVGDGVVAFAGPVAGRGVVTIDHGAGLVSSITGMSALQVAARQHVRAGDLLGTASVGLHLGFRLHGHYVDPALMFRRPVHAILVPVDGAGPT